MSGVPAELLMPTDYVVLRLGLVDEVGFDAALLLERIRWRCERRPGGWVATYAELSDDTRLSRKRVMAAACVLQERGWLRAVNAGEGTRTLRWSLIQDDPKSPEGTMPKIPVGDDQSSLGGFSSSIESTKDYVPPTPSDPPSLFAVPAEPAVKDAFDHWWSLWPRKQDKGHARKAYARAVKSTAPDVLYAALVVQAEKLIQDQKRGFCPLPATWLNGERWLDEVTPVPVHGGRGFNLAAHLLAQDMASAQTALTGSWDA